jgi:uncharacterized protein with beta-barrel porin domain
LISVLHCRRLGRPPKGVQIGIVAALLTLAAGGPALAQNATWSGPGGDWSDGANWIGGAPPSGVATFNGANPTTIFSSADVTVQTMRFTGSTAYIFDICNCFVMTVTGQGVVNNSTATQTFDVGGGTLNFLNSSTIGPNVDVFNRFGGTTIFGNSFGGGIDNASAGQANITNSFGGNTAFFGSTSGGSSSITNIGIGAITLFLENSNAGNATIRNFSGGATVFFEQSTGGNARFITDNDLDSTVDFSLTLGPNLDGVVTAGSIEGGGSFIIGSNNLIVGSNNLSTTISGALIDGGCGCGGPGTLTKVGSGTLTFASGIDLSQFFGSLVVNGGTVVMDGDMSGATLATANVGGTLAGAGILPPTFIDGGTLSPGNGTTGNVAQLGVSGDLQFAPGSTYAVDVAPTGAPGIPFTTSADFTLAFGPVALGGTLRAVGVGGAGYTLGAIYPVLGTYTGLNGTRFDKLFIAGSFGSTKPIITYDPLDQTVYLQLIQGEVSSQLTRGATQNQIALAAGLDNALKDGADFGAFTPLYNLSGDAFLKALDQVSGEPNTGVFQSVYQSVGNFINSMLNPFNGGRGAFGPATPYMAESDEPDVDAYAPKRRVSRQAQQAMAAAMPVKAAPARDNRYAVWANGHGGQTSIDGNGVVGSHQTNVRGYGFAAGLDYRVSPEALVGFAMAGGNSSWGLAEGLGGGNTDNFHAGAYGSLRYGPAYLSAAMAYGHHWVYTKRNVVVPGFATLEGDYDANSFGGRIEAGYRYGQGSFGITPYAALQASVVRLPAYAEHATGGSNAFALQYERQSDNLFRTELGSWFDHSRVIPGGVMTLRGRAAWAHDEGADRALTGAFPALPGSTFLVQGASPGSNFALLSAGAEWKYWNGMSLSARFDSELSDRSRGYGGTGTFRYIW